ncbi:MAG: hypothetical protein WCF57_18685 [Pyrinomonadaceae bacterium]
MQRRQGANKRDGSFLCALASLRDALARGGRVVHLLILLHLGITIPLAYRLSIWVDEAFTLDTTGRGISYAFHQAIKFELQPPLYFVLLNLWRDLNGSIFFARLFSILCVALAIKVAASLAQRLWKNVHPGWVAAVLALHPLMVWAAIEIRVYALAILLTALLLLLFYDGYVAAAASARARWLYLLLSILSLYTYYYLGFILFANACALLALRRWRLLFLYLVHMTAVALCFVPMVLIVMGQVNTHTRPLTSAPSWWESFKFITWRVKEYILPAEETRLIGLRRWTLRLAYVVIFLSVARSRGKRLLTTANLLTWAIVTVTSLFFLAALLATTEEMMLPRHTAVLFLPSILLAFSLLSIIPVKKGVLIGALVMSVFNVVSLSTVCATLTRDRNWDQVAAYIREHETAGQPILVFHAGAALPLSHYYRGANALVPVPRENRFETFDIRDYVLRDEQEILDALARAPGEHEEVWLVTDGVCRYLGLDYNCPALEEFVNKHYAVETSRAFSNTQVRLLRRKPRS